MAEENLSRQAAKISFRGKLAGLMNISQEEPHRRRVIGGKSGHRLTCAGINPS
ncbi:MAG: hypothetical protein ABIB93_05715 [Chloroflexota bacterium]